MARKTYDLKKSPFYKIPTPHVLSRLLKINVDRLNRRSDLYEKYYRRQIPKNNGGIRETETPYGELRRIHERILLLLKRISIPDFLHSGIKGRSYLSNAKTHIGSSDCFCLDIQKFFPSTTRGHTYNFFSSQMRCHSDVAAILANLCTVDGHLPTGSPISTLVSYFIHSEMFHQLNRLSARHSVTMTVYVDDVVFSGAVISNEFRIQAKQIISCRGLRPHKYRFYSNNAPKEITGVIVNGNQLRLPQRRHFWLFEQLSSLWKANTGEDKEYLFRRALSRVSEGAQIEERLKNRKRALMAAKPAIFCYNQKNNVENVETSLLSRWSALVKLLVRQFIDFCCHSGTRGNRKDIPEL